MKPALDMHRRLPVCAKGERRAGLSSSPSRLLLAIGMLGLLICAEWAFMNWACPALRPAPKGMSPKAAFLLRMSGYETASLREGRKVRLKIGSLVVAPRKYLVFNIQPLNEALFEDFSVEYHCRPQDGATFPAGDIQQMLLPYDSTAGLSSGPFGMKLGVITRGIILRFTLTVFVEGTAKTLIKSERAELDFKSNQVRLENATIEQVELKRLVKTRHAILKNGAGYVAVPGDYTILHTGGIVRGKGLKTPL